MNDFGTLEASRASYQSKLVVFKSLTKDFCHAAG